LQRELRADSLIADTAGSNIPIRMPITVITTNSSTSVNARGERKRNAILRVIEGRP
jgi:hypothetical protein